MKARLARSDGEAGWTTLSGDDFVFTQHMLCRVDRIARSALVDAVLAQPKDAFVSLYEPMRVLRGLSLEHRLLLGILANAGGQPADVSIVSIEDSGLAVEAGVAIAGDDAFIYLPRRVKPFAGRYDAAVLGGFPGFLRFSEPDGRLVAIVTPFEAYSAVQRRMLVDAARGQGDR